ncbi:MAG: hypothetical protein ACTSRC_17030 [Candidatus Helarchaeota archaeon]
MTESLVYHSPFYDQRRVMKLPPSAKFILYLLKLKGPMNRKRLIQETLMPDRTVGFALKLLLNEQIIEKEDPAAARQRLPKGKRKRKRQDRRITNYTLTSSMHTYEFAEV